MLAALLLLSAHAAASSGREEHPLAKSISTAVHATGARLEGLSARTSHALAHSFSSASEAAGSALHELQHTLREGLPHILDKPTRVLPEKHAPHPAKPLPNAPSNLTRGGGVPHRHAPSPPHRHAPSPPHRHAPPPPHRQHRHAPPFVAKAQPPPPPLPPPRPNASRGAPPPPPPPLPSPPPHMATRNGYFASFSAAGADAAAATAPTQRA